MKTKVILEISDGGFSVQRKELEAGETVVAMSFKKLSGGAYDANVAAIGGPFNKEMAINYATATASVLARVTEVHPAWLLYFQIFEKTLHDCLVKESEKRMKQSEEEIINELVNSGTRREDAEMVIRAVKDIAEREARNENRK